jgi:hypothetical protein
MINSRESLLRYSGALADALAFHARSSGLHVVNTDLQNSLIKGKYEPENERALDNLAALPAPQWNELASPLDVPMLNLPSIEIEMTVAGEYSQVFSFIETLPDFPVLVCLTGLGLTEDQEESAFRLKIRGYYYGTEKSGSTAVAENTALHN